MSEVTASGNVLESFDEIVDYRSESNPIGIAPGKISTTGVSDKMYTPAQIAAQHAQANQRRTTEMLLVPQPSDDSSEQPLLTQPAWLQSDCLCRGGQWVGADPQDPNRGGNCVPSDKPTGKYFDIPSRGCKPFSTKTTQGCTYKGVNVCLLGFGLALGGLAIFLLTRKKPA